MNATSRVAEEPTMSQEFTGVYYREAYDERYETQWFIAFCPEVEVVTQGETIEHAEAMLKEAVELVLEQLTPEALELRRREGPPDHPDFGEEEIWESLTEVKRDVLTVEVNMREVSVG